MIKFTATIEKFADKGEKTGWTYVEIPFDIAQQIKPGNKKSFRVKGFLDKHPIECTSLIPMGEGVFILPLNALFRKAIKKIPGEKLTIQLVEDLDEKKLSNDLLACLQDEPKALKTFESFTKSHQNYYSNWIESAKTEPTRAKRIVKAIRGLSMGLPFNEMMHLDK